MDDLANLTDAELRKRLRDLQRPMDIYPMGNSSARHVPSCVSQPEKWEPIRAVVAELKSRNALPTQIALADAGLAELEKTDG